MGFLKGIYEGFYIRGSRWPVLHIRVPLEVLLIRAPNYIADLKWAPNLENIGSI